MIKRVIYSVFLVFLLTHTSYNRCFIESGFNYILEPGFKYLLAGPCSNALLSPIQKATEYIVGQPTTDDTTSNVVQYYAPSVTTALTALAAYRLASSTGYDYWMVRSLALSALVSRCYTLFGSGISSVMTPLIRPVVRPIYNMVKPDVTCNNPHLLIQHFSISPKDPLYDWLNQKRKYSLSSSAELLHTLGWSIDDIKKMNTTSVSQLFSNQIATNIIGSAVAHLI